MHNVEVMKTDLAKLPNNRYLFNIFHPKRKREKNPLGVSLRTPLNSWGCCTCVNLIAEHREAPETRKKIKYQSPSPFAFGICSLRLTEGDKKSPPPPAPLSPPPPSYPAPAATAALMPVKKCHVPSASRLGTGQ